MVTVHGWPQSSTWESENLAFILFLAFLYFFILCLYFFILFYTFPKVFQTFDSESMKNLHESIKTFQNSIKSVGKVLKCCLNTSGSWPALDSELARDRAGNRPWQLAKCWLLYCPHFDKGCGSAAHSFSQQLLHKLSSLTGRPPLPALLDRIHKIESLSCLSLWY